MPTLETQLVWGDTTRIDDVETSKFTYKGVSYTYVIGIDYPDPSFGRIRGLKGKTVEHPSGDNTVRVHLSDCSVEDFPDVDQALVWLIENQPV